MGEGSFFKEKEIKPRLSSEQCTAEDLKRHLILVFGSYKKASQVAGFTEGRLHQIFMGYAVPQNPDIIKRLARAWNVDLVILTRILETLREPQLVTADKYEAEEEDND